MEFTLEELRSLLTVDSVKEPSCQHPYIVGEWYLIRTVTMIQVGRLKAVFEQELVLEDAAWIADTGRFHDCLKDADVINEAEPFIEVTIVGRGSIVDATVWRHRKKVDQK